MFCTDVSVKGNKGIVHPQNVNSAVISQFSQVGLSLQTNAKWMLNVHLVCSFALADMFLTVVELKNDKNKKKKHHVRNVIKLGKPISSNHALVDYNYEIMWLWDKKLKSCHKIQN